jgi:hypothetical protein
MDRWHFVLGLKATSDVERVVDGVLHGFSEVNELPHVASKDILFREGETVFGCVLVKQFLYNPSDLLEVRIFTVTFELLIFVSKV